LAEAGGNSAHYGWASVQLDGGMERVLEKIEGWFSKAVMSLPAPEEQHATVGALRLGLLSAGSVSAPVAAAMARLTRTIVSAGGTVVVPRPATLLQSDEFLRATLAAAAPNATLAYGGAFAQSGLHVMDAPSTNWVEQLTGLGATGVEVLLALPGERPAQGHPMLPMLQAVAGSRTSSTTGFDVELGGEPSAWAEQLLQRVVDVAARRYVPQRFAQGDVDFQLTRGLLGVTV
jgi:hypothetical protein